MGKSRHFEDLFKSDKGTHDLHRTIINECVDPTCDEAIRNLKGDAEKLGAQSRICLFGLIRVGFQRIPFVHDAVENAVKISSLEVVGIRNTA